MYHLKVGISPSYHMFDYLIQEIYIHSMYMLSYSYAKFEEIPCMDTDVSTYL